MLRSALVGLLAFAGFALAQAPATTGPLTRIAFGSCADQDKPCPAWDGIASLKPELLILLGDTIYADLDKSKKVTPELIQSKYDQLLKIPGFAKLREAVPMIGTYDDHDYGKNDGDKTWALKNEAQKIMLDFYGVPANDPRRTREGAYHAQVFGPEGKRVQVIILDGRYHRSPVKKEKFDPRTRISAYIPNTEPDATFLGEEQWKWLAEQLKVPAELRLLCSGIQVLSEDHPFERWTIIPAERERLFALIKKTGANGVVVLSGDRHLAELSMNNKFVGYPLYDVTSSGFNQATESWRPAEANRHRIAAVPYGNNFGYITIDWSSATSPRVSLQIRDEAAEIYCKQDIRLGLLKMNPQDAAAANTPEGVLSPGEAAQMVGKEITVQFAVKSGRRNTDKSRLFLNSHENYRDESNFVVVLGGKALADKYKDATGDTFKGKIVRVKGKVELYQGKPEIIVTSETALEIVE
jgi:alkaline phosphatase D